MADIRRFERDLHDYIQHNAKQIFDTIVETGTLPDDTVEELKKAVAEVKQEFRTSEQIAAAEEEAEAMSAEDVGQHTVTRVRPAPPPQSS